MLTSNSQPVRLALRKPPSTPRTQTFVAMIADTLTRAAESARNRPFVALALRQNGNCERVVTKIEYGEVTLRYAGALEFITVDVAGTQKSGSVPVGLIIAPAHKSGGAGVFWRAAM